MFPIGPKQGHHHIATRFMEAGQDYRFLIRLDGEDVTMGATEAIGGANGLVCLLVQDEIRHPEDSSLVLNRRNRACDCGQGPEETVRRGVVEISYLLYPEHNCHCVNCGHSTYLSTRLIVRGVVPFCSFDCKREWENTKKLATLGVH